MEVVSTLVEVHVFREIENELEFLLLKRASNEKYGNVWQMVTGSIENEKAFETALRETKEETGLIPLRFWVVPNVNSFYSNDKNQVIMVPVFAILVANNSEVKISTEHSEYKWVRKDEAKKFLAWPGQRQSVDIIYDYFINHQSFLKFVEIEL
jgi:dATP pyrophosphohydrolase